MSFQIGDHGPAFRPFQEWLNRKFSSYSNLRIDEYYGLDEAGVVAEAMRRYGLAPSFKTVNIAGMLTQVEGGIATDEFLTRAAWHAPSKPVIVTVAGFRGDMFTGPAYFTARWLEEQQLVRVQPIGYDNLGIPFNLPDGRRALDEQVQKLNGINWMLLSHSEGSMIASEYHEDVIKPNLGRGVYVGYKGGIAFGNPDCEKGVHAEWVPDRPGADSEGLSDRRMVNTPSNWKNVIRKGDLYADTKAGDPATEMKRSILRIVARAEISGQDSLTEQLGELIMDPLGEGWAVFQAITQGIGFGINMDPHNVFDLRPCIDFCRQTLGV